MVPSQFQHRELIQQILIGWLFVILVSFLFLDLNPKIMKGVLALLIESKGISGWIVIPIAILFAVSYVAGTSISNFQGTRLNNTNSSEAKQNFLSNPKRTFMDWVKSFILRYVLGIRSTERLNIGMLMKYDPLTFTQILPKELEDAWGIKIVEPVTKETIHSFFGLCSSYVSCFEASSAIVNIERHYVAMLFNARLTFIFLLASSICAIEFLNRATNYLPSFFPIPWWAWVLLIAFFWMQARQAANRTFISGFDNAHLIYLAFINYRVRMRSRK